MVIRRELMLVLLAFCLTGLFTAIPSSGVSIAGAGQYDHWLDVNDDGRINVLDLIKVAGAIGTTGTAINKTELLLRLEARIDALNATVMALKETRHCAGTEHIVTIGNQITITFPVGMFTEPPQLSAVVLVMTGAYSGKVCYIQNMSVGTASATLDLQFWDGGTWQDIADGIDVQVSYTAVGT